MKRRQYTGFLQVWLVAGLATLVYGCAEPGSLGQLGVNDANDRSTDVNGSQKMTFERMSPLVEAYRDINEILDLNEDESRILDDVKAKHREIFEAWYANEWLELKQLEKQYLSAAKSKNLRKMKELNSKGGKMREFKFQERDMQVAFESELISAVPADKLDSWKAHRISVLLMEFLQPLTLTEDQQQAIRDLAPNVVKKLNRKQRDNWRGYGTDGLEKQFAASVLTAEQSPAFEELKSKNKMRMLRWNNVKPLR